MKYAEEKLSKGKTTRKDNANEIGAGDVKER